MVNRAGFRKKAADSGVALILVLLAILVLTTLAAAMVFNARSETLASYNYRIGTQAEYVAMAGVQRALNFFNSTRYSPVPPTTATTYYNVSIYATNPVNLYFANESPVTCTSGCSSTGNVALQPTSGASVFPPSSATGGVNVVTNWLSEMNGTSISDGVGGTGNYSVKAWLMEYHTVNNAFFGVPAAGCSDSSAGMGICRQPFEVWKVTSTGTWNSNLGAGASLPTVQVVATISPMFLPYFGNALYGLCSVTLGGGICTDSYNSAKGSYGATDSTCVDPSTGTSNAQAIGAGIGSNGGVTINGAANRVGGNVTYANQNSNSSCDTGFQGTATGVRGSVLPGPAVPAPPTINMSTWGYPTTTPAIAPPSGMGTTVTNVYFRQASAPTAPPGLTCPAGFTGYVVTYNVTSSGGTNTYNSPTCSGLSGSGTSADPYRLGNLTAGSPNAGTVNLIAPTTPLSNPVFVAANSISVSNNGYVNTSNQAPATPATGSYDPNPPAPTAATASAFVIDVAGSVDLSGGHVIMNYNSLTPGIPSPDYLVMNIMGTGTALNIGGQAQVAGMINIPNGNASLTGSGGNGSFFGAILANSITDSGGYPVHYDLNSRTISGQMFTAQVVSVTRPKY